MSIRGLTDNARAAFPTLGKLRKGAPRPNDRQPGVELPYWRFDGANKDIEAVFASVYGERPTEVEVLLPYARIEDNFSAWKEAWGAGGLLHRCDGETCVLWLTDDGTYSREQVPCPGGCKAVGRLNVLLPGLLRAGHVGYVTMETHSINDILSILGTLRATAEARGVEDMRGILFILRRQFELISTPAGNGKRARRAKCMVKLVPATEWVRAQIEHLQRAALPETAADDEEAGDTLALPAEEPSPPQILDAEPIVDDEEQYQHQEDDGADDGAVAQTHWIENPVVRQRFWAWTHDLGLSSSDVLGALGVQRVRDFPGSMHEAKERIEAWIQACIDGYNTESL